MYLPFLGDTSEERIALTPNFKCGFDFCTFTSIGDGGVIERPSTISSRGSGDTVPSLHAECMGERE